jgi:hypothetical protein
MEAAALALQQALALGTGRMDKEPDHVSDALLSRSDDVGGRGIFTTRALAEGEELLRVPHAALVTARVGQSYPYGAALKRAEDAGETGSDVDFPNEESYIVMALVLEDAMRRHATAEADAAAVASVLELAGTKDAQPAGSDTELGRARRHLYYAALPTIDELRAFHPLLMVPEPEPEPEPSAAGTTSPPIPAAVRDAIRDCGLELGDDDSAAAVAAMEDYWCAIVAMHRTVLSEHRALCAILGPEFASSHPAEEWLYCWTMVMSRNFLLQIGDPALGGGMAFSALVPFADLMNHSHVSSVRWEWDSGTGQFVMKVCTADGHGVGEGTELTIDYSPGHSGQDPRQQQPPFYFGIFYGFLERQARDKRLFLETADDPALARRPRHRL